MDKLTKTFVIAASSVVVLGLEVGFARNSFAEVTFEQTKSYLLSNGRDRLMKYCTFGRQLNSRGLSFFDPRFQLDTQPTNRTVREFEAFLSAKAAAMFEVCPDVK